MVTSAVYKISLLPDYHSPPEPSFTNLSVSFLSPLSQQEELVSVTFVEDVFCEDTTSISVPRTYVQKGKTLPSSSLSSQLPIILGIIFLLVLVLLVMCVALQKTSTSTSGFQSHLPPGGQTPHQSHEPAYSLMSSPQLSMHSSGIGGPGVYPSSSTPRKTVNSPQHTPYHGSGLPSTAAHRRTRSSSPKQHGLFSQ